MKKELNTVVELKIKGEREKARIIKKCTGVKRGIDKAVIVKNERG